MIRALIADDEPLLRERLAMLLGKLWPELVVIANARNGREAVELFDEHAPQVVFLDVHMPGMNGIEAARAMTAPRFAAPEGGDAAHRADSAPELTSFAAPQGGATALRVAERADSAPELTSFAAPQGGATALRAAERADSAPELTSFAAPQGGATALRAAERAVARRTQIVFVTAYEQYAVQAFEQGAIDYLVKPFDEKRLADTVQRLRERFDAAPPAHDAATDALLERLAAELRARAAPRTPLQWIKASVGTSVRLIPVDQVAYLRSDEKYTLVVWEGGEALIRKTIRELADELDPERFVQVHRSVIVNLHHVNQVVRGLNETADVHLKGRDVVLPVSRSYLHLFKQM